MILVNFKTYPEGTGERAVVLAKLCEKVGRETGAEIVPLVQAVDLFRVKQEVKIPVWVQHLDWQAQGQFTGFTNLEAAAGAGAAGALLNHAEHKMAMGTIERTVKRLRSLKFKSLRVMVCCRSLGQAERLVKFKPDFLAYEPPELIGGKISVSTAKPEAIKHFVEICGKVQPVIGAGIKTAEDVAVGVRLGARGFLVASGVVLAHSPEKVLTDLAKEDATLKKI